MADGCYSGPLFGLDWTNLYEVVQVAKQLKRVWVVKFPDRVNYNITLHPRKDVAAGAEIMWPNNKIRRW